MSLETSQIEADIAESRHRLSDTLDAMGGKLSPGQMLDEALGLAKGQAGEFTANLGRQVRDNPLPAVLIAAGVAALFLQNNQRHHRLQANEWDSDRRFRTLEEARWRTTRLADETDDQFQARLHDAQAAALGMKQRADEAVEAFKLRVADAAHKLEDLATSARERISSTFSGAVHMAQDAASDLGARASAAKHSAQDIYTQNPLAAGAIAMAVGAILGAATPLSDAEREALADVADAATQKGAEAVNRGAEFVAAQTDALH